MAVTKEGLIRYFSSLDVAVLEQLKKYSEFLIIPEEDLLTNVTMRQMVSKAHQLADSLFPEWTDRSKSDFGEFLVELFALFSEKDFWYINAFANEGIFRKMRSYSNAFAKAHSLGYHPRTCKGSSATFSVSFEKGEETTYGRGELIISVDGMEFSNDEPFTLSEALDETSVTLVLREGKQVTEAITYNGHSIFLSKPNIDIDSIAIIIDNVAYTRVPTFGNSDSGSAHFMALPEENGACSIYFGQGSFGIQPALGKPIFVEYRTCNGEKGNVGINLSEVVDSIDYRKAVSATMLTSAIGGVFAETLWSIKENAPIAFAYRQAAINEATTESLLNSFPFIKQSVTWSVGNKMFYSVIPTSGKLDLTTSEKKILSEEFEPRMMIGFTGTYVPSAYVDIVKRVSADYLILDVIVAIGYDIMSTESNVRQIMSDLTNPLIGATYGQAFTKSEGDVKMRSSIPGVQSISFKKMKGGDEEVLEDFTLGTTEIFKKINQDKLIVRVHAV